ncbi:Hg(II)-responsive transcriptional regulator [Pseudomonas aeruginosa]|uniref:Hg(II)-responsive transcriptional regulator n=1 Tax=Pseudomonas aeruginosa TaxID=287 RepID=UPI000EB023E2|nr:Hg(II)-responsive transcriptional regulator [Pseudomonas aeruginosa]ELV1373758.1 Hg(II)-responsive transcriptional regulator [Pseudomonas aeruginosa]MCX3418069.1 Hg(II)-responsive transcriptional regulator [Pseudomonas aeruginosa]MDE9770038.1 Hg(II)-responsive transcriptional regulator [Pseudomonas aeruginosa]TSC47812.1 Hg(II)-responsive transcriptional regulator [Pseudomonas aeruginosa]HBO3127248.1 Hg(II)-responsive transcriptional regulator [Pseudomonas aeruginosa]
MATDLTIGKLANAAGVSVETIRYYQRRGLLDEPAKPLGGHRHYPQGMVKRLSFIKRAQALGFTLTEIGGLLTLDESCACTETRALAAHKLALITQKMADLAAMQLVLGGLLQQCDAGDGGASCPIIEALARE